MQFLEEKIYFYQVSRITIFPLWYCELSLGYFMFMVLGTTIHDELIERNFKRLRFRSGFEYKYQSD